MRIGEFADLYDMSVSSVRYYVNIGLLVPRSMNNRYVFAQRDMADMDLICALKNVGISLEDILQIINAKRINVELGKTDNSQIKLALIKQREYLQDTIRSHENKILSINKLIENLNVQEIDLIPEFNNGLDLGFLNYLTCPVCGAPLKIMPELIQNNQFIDATISCACGYNAQVHDGIMTIPAPENNDLIDRQYVGWRYDYLQPHEMNSIIKICDWMQTFLIKKTKESSFPLLIIENFASNYCFLLDQAKRLPTHHYYILTDTSESVIREYKHRIEKANPELKVLYITGSNLLLPFKEQIIDIMIDLFNNGFFASYNHSFYTEHIKNYLKRNSLILGSYTFVHPMSQSVQIYRSMYPDSHKGNRVLSPFKEDLASNHMEIVAEQSDQPMTTSTINWHHQGDDLAHWSYAAKLLAH